jgi:sulfhydrogenase subunit delta
LSPDAQKQTKQLPKVGIYGLTGCAGDQLTIVNCEDQILDIFGAADIRSFLMAMSNNVEGELDVALVEGSVSSQGDKAMLEDIRKRSKILIAIGNCACNGGPQAACAMENNFKERFKQVYGDVKLSIPEPLDAKPLSAYVQVDYMIPGCPIDKWEFLRALGRLVKGDAPQPIRYPVCVECKYNENECLLFKNEICLGPITVGGCDSVCINHNIPCVGCRGPVTEANVAGEVEMLVNMKHPHFPKRVNFDYQDVRNRAMMYGGTTMAELLDNVKLKGAKK